MSSADQDLMRTWANAHVKCVRQRTRRQRTTKYKAGTLPLNIYQTAAYQGERVEFAPDEGVEHLEFSNDEGRESVPTLRNPEDDQLSEYDDDSSDNEENGAFNFVIRRTRNSVSFCSAQNTKWTDSEDNQQGFALDVISQNITVSLFFP